MKILIRATNWVGDAVMSVPALEAIRTRFPAAHIAILARPWVAGLYRPPLCDEVIPYTAARGWRDAVAKWRLARRLAARQFDCAILLQNAFEAAALTWLARIPRRIGYDRDARGVLLTDAVAVPKPGEIPRHERYYYLELLRRAGLIDALPAAGAIRLPGVEALRARGLERFRALGFERDVAGVSPGAAFGGAKRWLPERFAEAAREVAGNLGADVAVFGSAEEQALCDEVARMAGGRSLAGKTSLAEFVELAAACCVFLSNDSGAMHVAAAAGVPAVAVFGATDHETTGPAGPWSRVVREPVDCSPCLLRECPIDHRCMTLVDAPRVAAAALELVRLKRE